MTKRLLTGPSSIILLQSLTCALAVSDPSVYVCRDLLQFQHWYAVTALLLPGHCRTGSEQGKYVHTVWRVVKSRACSVTEHCPGKPGKQINQKVC